MRAFLHGTLRGMPLTAISAVAGVALLAYAVASAGPAEIVEGLRRLGAGFALVLALSGLRFTARTLSWMVCVEGEPRLAFGDALSAKLIGDALGNLTPMGLFVSEPAKVLLVQRSEHAHHTLSAMLVENVVCALSAVVMIAVGACGVLLFLPGAGPVTRVSTILLAGATAVFAGGVLLTARPGLISDALAGMRERGLVPSLLHRSVDRIRTVEELVFGFSRRHPKRLVPLLALTLAFHAVAIAEVYVTLTFLSTDVAPTWLTAFLLEAVNKIVTVAFTFVPLRLGIDETTTGFVSGALQLGTATGVTLALVRKARMLCWSTVGLALLALRSLRSRP